MTSYLDELKADLPKLQARARTLLDGAINENRSLTTLERGDLDDLETRLKATIDKRDELQAEHDRSARLAGQARDAGIITTTGVIHRGAESGRSGRTAASDSRFAAGSWLANEVRAMTGGAGLGGAITPTEFASALFDKLSATSVVLRAGAQIVMTTRDTFSMPRLIADPTAAWIAEGGAIPPSDPNGGSIVAVPKKLAALVQVSNEVLMDSTPSALDVTANTLLRSLALTLDLGALEGSGAGNQPTGLRATAGIQTVSMGANGAVIANLDPFADGIGMLAEANAEATAIIMAPRTWRTLLKIKEITGGTKPVLQESAGAGTAGVARSLYGVPVFLSSQLSIAETQGSSTDCSSAYVVQADQIVAVIRSLDNPPFSQQLGGSYDDDVAPFIRLEGDGSRLFSSDQSELRAVLRADIAVPNPAAIVRIVGIKP
jgi:HK97 family phage major capsid protein